MLKNSSSYILCSCHTNKAMRTLWFECSLCNWLDDPYVETGEAPTPASESKQETSKPRVWSCAICTYDNEEGMSVCDICGVLRTPLVNNNRKTGICQWPCTLVVSIYPNSD